MAGGRPRKPRKLAELEGNPGKRRLRNDLDAPEGIPRPPSWLPSRAKWFYREIAALLGEMGIITLADRRTLEILANAYARYRRMDEYCRRHGETYMVETKSGTSEQMRPQRRIADKAEAVYMRLLSELGLSPTARARLGIEGEGKGKNVADAAEEWIQRNRARHEGS